MLVSFHPHQVFPSRNLGKRERRRLAKCPLYRSGWKLYLALVFASRFLNVYSLQIGHGILCRKGCQALNRLSPTARRC